MERRRRSPSTSIALLGVPLAMSNILSRWFPKSTDRSMVSDGLIARGAEEEDEDEDKKDDDEDDDSEDEGDGYSE